MSDEAQQLPPANFETLVNVLMQPAAMSLGLMAPPGQEPIVDLPQAQLMIDLLRLLRERTDPQCSEDERKFVNETLDGLQRAFVAVKQQQDA
jgi:hypothetical protein